MNTRNRELLEVLLSPKAIVNKRKSEPSLLKLTTNWFPLRKIYGFSHNIQFTTNNVLHCAVSGSLNNVQGQHKVSFYRFSRFQDA